MCLACLRASRAYVPRYLTCLRTFAFYVPYVPYVPLYLYVTYLPSFFACLKKALIILRAYILFMYMLIKLTQINEHLYTFIKYFLF